MIKIIYILWSVICIVGALLEIFWFLIGSGIFLYSFYNGFLAGNIQWLALIKFYSLLVILPIIIYEIVISFIAWFLWQNYFGALQVPLKERRGSMLKNLFKNLFSMAKSTNRAVEDANERWRRELDNIIGSLNKSENEQPSYSEKVWFFEQFYIFITDRTMAHPNPGIREDEEYKWTHPDEIIIDDNKNWFYPSHNEDLTNRLNRYKVLYLEKKISVYEYCKERENIQKEDINFRSHFRY